MSFGMTAASYKVVIPGPDPDPDPEPEEPSGAPTHGDQVTRSNVGHTAYYDDSLGRTITDADLTEISGTHWISDYANDGHVFEKIYFSGNIVMDRNNVTFKGCKFDNTFENYKSGVSATGTVLEYCTISPPNLGDDAIRFADYTARYCILEGCSDGAKANGGQTSLEYCYIRVKGAVGDHNDGIQNVGGGGNVLIRGCNIDMVQTNGIGGANACVMSADLSASVTLHMTIEDCWFKGGTSAYQLRLYDGGLTPNITYSASGNKFVRGVPPLDRGSANTTPLNQITWSNNTYADNGELIPLS